MGSFISLVHLEIWVPKTFSYCAIQQGLKWVGLMGSFILLVHDWKLESLIPFLQLLYSTKVHTNQDDKMLLNRLGMRILRVKPNIGC